MKQSIDYLGASQSAFNLAQAYNRRKDLRIRLPKVAWAFYFNPPSQNR